MPSFDRHRGADRPPSSGLGNRYARASDALVQLREENAVAAGGFPKPNSPFMVGETVMAKATDWEKYYTGRVSTNHNGSRSSTVTFDDGDVVVCEWAFMKALGDGDEYGRAPSPDASHLSEIGSSSDESSSSSESSSDEDEDEDSDEEGNDGKQKKNKKGAESVDQSFVGGTVRKGDLSLGDRVCAKCPGWPRYLPGTVKENRVLGAVVSFDNGENKFAKWRQIRSLLVATRGNGAEEEEKEEEEEEEEEEEGNTQESESKADDAESGADADVDVDAARISLADVLSPRKGRPTVRNVYKKKFKDISQKHKRKEKSKASHQATIEAFKAAGRKSGAKASKVLEEQRKEREAQGNLSKWSEWEKHEAAAAQKLKEQELEKLAREEQARQEEEAAAAMLKASELKLEREAQEIKEWKAAADAAHAAGDHHWFTCNPKPEHMIEKEAPKQLSAAEQRMKDAMRDAQQKKRDRKRSAATEIERKHQEKIRLEAKLARDRAAAEEAAKVAAKAEVNYMQRVEATKAEKKKAATRASWASFERSEASAAEALTQAALLADKAEAARAATEHELQKCARATKTTVTTVTTTTTTTTTDDKSDRDEAGSGGGDGGGDGEDGNDKNDDSRDEEEEESAPTPAPEPEQSTGPPPELVLILDAIAEPSTITTVEEFDKTFGGGDGEGEGRRGATIKPRKPVEQPRDAKEVREQKAAVKKAVRKAKKNLALGLLGGGSGLSTGKSGDGKKKRSKPSKEHDFDHLDSDSDKDDKDNDIIGKAKEAAADLINTLLDSDKKQGKKRNSRATRNSRAANGKKRGSLSVADLLERAERRAEEAATSSSSSTTARRKNVSVRARSSKRDAATTSASAKTTADTDADAGADVQSEDVVAAEDAAEETSVAVAEDNSTAAPPAVDEDKHDYSKLASGTVVYATMPHWKHHYLGKIAADEKQDAQRGENTVTIVFEDGDVKNVPFDLVVLPEEAEKAKEYAAAVVQAWARGTIARARYRPVLLKRLAAKREAEANAGGGTEKNTPAQVSTEKTTAAAAKALSSGDQGTALKLLLQELERQRLAVDAMSVTIADLERSQFVGTAERSAAAELVKQHTVA